MWGWRETSLAASMMLVVWALYGAGTMLSIPRDFESGDPSSWVLLGAAVTAFAASYVLGVLAVFAPAGVGVRELAMVTFLAPVVGVPSAAAAALVIRAIHTLSDLTLAGASWAFAGWRARQQQHS